MTSELITSKTNGAKYKEINGLFFHEQTPIEVCNILSSYLHTGCRLKLYYGDTETGRDYNEEFDTIGEIGRSTGTIKIPLLIKTSRSSGGGAILDHCIVKIKNASGIVLYQNPKYVPPIVEVVGGDMFGYPFNTLINGELHGRHKTQRGATMCANKLR